MLFSIYYRIEHRQDFLNKYFEKVSKECSENDYSYTIDRLTDLMELMVQLLLNEDKIGLFGLLTKKNTKSARLFFNYLTCSNIRSINKEIIKDRLNEIFKAGD